MIHTVDINKSLQIISLGFPAQTEIECCDNANSTSTIQPVHPKPFRFRFYSPKLLLSFHQESHCSKKNKLISKKCRNPENPQFGIKTKFKEKVHAQITVPILASKKATPTSEHKRSFAE